VGANSSATFESDCGYNAVVWAGPTVLLGAADDSEPALAALQEQIKLASFPNARRLVVHAASAHAPGIRAALSARGLTGVTVHTERPAQS
jgi:hypothetical protein